MKAKKAKRILKWLAIFLAVAFVVFFLVALWHFFEAILCIQGAVSECAGAR